MESPANTSSSLEAAYKNLVAADQSGIFFCLSLAAFTEHCVESDLLPIIEDITEAPCVDADRKKIASELTTAMVASCHFHNDKPAAELFGRDPDMLRGITVMLILADSDNPDKARQKTPYSRNRDEAKEQAIAEVLRTLNVSNKKTTARLNGSEFSSKWNEFSEILVPGALAGMKGMAHLDIVAAALRRIGFLSPTSKAVLQEYIKIITAGISKGQAAT